MLTEKDQHSSVQVLPKAKTYTKIKDRPVIGHQNS